VRGRGYPNPSGTGMRFNFSSPLGIGRVTSKYMRIRYEDGEGKTRHHPAPLPCLVVGDNIIHFNVLKKKLSSEATPDYLNS